MTLLAVTPARWALKESSLTYSILTKIPLYWTWLKMWRSYMQRAPTLSQEGTLRTFRKAFLGQRQTVGERISLDEGENGAAVEIFGGAGAQPEMSSHLLI